MFLATIQEQIQPCLSITLRAACISRSVERRQPAERSSRGSVMHMNLTTAPNEHGKSKICRTEACLTRRYSNGSLSMTGICLESTDEYPSDGETAFESMAQQRWR